MPMVIKIEINIITFDFISAALYSNTSSSITQLAGNEQTTQNEM